jgi:DNA-binding NarL/FixJ family response regulator
MIGVAVLDDHPMVRAGLHTLLTTEQDMQPAGFAADEEQLWPLLSDTRPDVLLLDVHHPGRDGLELCLHLQRIPHGPAVVLYAASTPEILVSAAAIAGVNAVVNKASSGPALLHAIRAVARQPRPRPPITLSMKADAATLLESTDHAILAMRLAGHTLAEIAETLWLPIDALVDRVRAIVAALASAAQPAPDSTPARTAA